MLTTILERFAIGLIGVALFLGMLGCMLAYFDVLVR